MEVFKIGSESRKYPRVAFKKAVRYQLRGDEDLLGEVAQDLSEGGIRIRSNVFIPVGQEVRVGVQLSDSDQIVEVSGRVVWVRFNPYSEVYQVGIEFSSESAFSRWRISRFAGSA
jgi:c-di-GMP-binding flagellar brake protein YcgR